MKKVLVTGGAGYIGSQMLLHLREAKIFPCVVDNLCSGRRENVLWGDLYQQDVADETSLAQIIVANGIDTILHFAAHIVVEESTRDPFKYFHNNFGQSFRMLQTALQSGVRRFVFSSTAAVYGQGEERPLKESAPLAPLNPYGRSKLAVEMLLQSMAETWPDFRYVALRYFNVAGADKELRLGQDYARPTHLITRALKTALGKYERLEIFGTDYPTPDGTAIRDYIDIDDLCAAHLLALDYLERGGESNVFNLGYGTGFSVREVVRVVKTVTGEKFPVIESGRRAGDPPVLIADSSRAVAELGWTPRYNDLEKIVEAGWKWELKLAKKG
jgi:UDP-glucose 4-epimerase